MWTRAMMKAGFQQREGFDMSQPEWARSCSQAAGWRQVTRSLADDLRPARLRPSSRASSAFTLGDGSLAIPRIWGAHTFLQRP